MCEATKGGSVCIILWRGSRFPSVRAVPVGGKEGQDSWGEGKCNPRFVAETYIQQAHYRVGDSELFPKTLSEIA